jgi:aminopeptidase N
VSTGVFQVNPHLKELDQFVINELHGAFMLDALKSSHQISIKVNNPDEINDIFDRISYSKGSQNVYGSGYEISLLQVPPFCA